MKCKQSRRRLHKYKYTLNGKTYFVILAERDRASYEDRHGVSLELCDYIEDTPTVIEAENGEDN